MDETERLESKFSLLLSYILYNFTWDDQFLQSYICYKKVKEKFRNREWIKTFDKVVMKEGLTYRTVKKIQKTASLEK